MNKKLIALAIASAFVAPAAMADSGNVAISGQLHMAVDMQNNGGDDTATKKAKDWYLTSNASNIKLSGNEDLGNGLKAVWQVQSFITMGGTGNTDTNTSTGDGISNGASYAGVTGGFGAVLLGKQEAPFKVVSRKFDLFNNYVGDSRNLVTDKGTGASAAGFDLRPHNTVAYATPNMSGFQATLALVLKEGTKDAGDTGATSLNAMYANGPITAGFGYEKHNKGLTNGVNTESGMRLAGGYAFGDAKVVALWQKLKDLGGTSGNDRTTWGLGGAYKMDANTIKAQYYKAGSRSNTSNTGANMWALGVDHAMSKRTTAYVAYARTSNDSGTSAFSAFGGGHGSQTGAGSATVAGKAPTALSLGMIHDF